MKFTLMLVLLGTLTVSASVYSQSTKLSLNLRNATVRQVLDEVEKVSQFKFFYVDEQIDVNRKVNVSVSGEKVEDVLASIFDTNQVRYKVFENNLVVLTPVVKNNITTPMQNFRVTGKVSDAGTGEPLLGVNIVVQGTTIGVVTDLDGNYSLEVPNQNATLVFSFVGYTTQTIAVAGRNTVDVQLAADTKSLEEVVVVGYGVQKKKLTTGATIQVKGEDIQKLNTLSAMTALQGVTPGVQITKSSGQPGEGFKVKIRGLGTTGNSSPLYIVDGISMGNIDYLSPADIESIDVLKDAASAAIYGARAANGVVLVTTKQGKSGKASVSYDGYYGVQNLYKTAPLLNAQEYAMIMNESRINSKQDPYDFAALVPDWNKIENGTWKGTNWLDEITVKNAPTQSHALNMVGGTERSVYSVGLAYVSQAGILGKPVASQYDRYNFRANTEHVLFKKNDRDIIKVGENLTYSFSQRSGIAIGNIYYNDVHNMLVANPFLPVYDENGAYHKQIAWNSQEANPIGLMEYTRGQNKSKNHQLTGNIFTEIQPIKNLRYRSTFSVNVSGNSYRSFAPAYDLSLSSHNSDNVVNQSMSLGMNWTFENTLSYAFKVADVHNFTVLAGTSAEKWGLGESINGSNVNSIFSDFDHAYLDNSKLVVVGKTNVGGNPWGEGGLLSYFGRVNYDYKEKYLLTAIMRGDASSNFAKGHRWGYFPSVSAGWVISNESFMGNTSSWLDFFKLRGSWGQNGNQSINPFQYLSTISFSGVNYFFGEDKAQATTGAYPDILPNPLVTWETSEQTDLGFDSRFFNGKLSLTFDWFNKSTKDWLVDPPQLLTYGTGNPFLNGGDVRNRGIEFVVGYNGNVGADFHYNVNANLAYQTNKVTRIENTEKVIHGLSNVLSQGTDEFYRAQVGYPIGYFYGYKTDGIFQNEAEVDAYTNKDGGLILPDAVPGDVRFVDVNEDGKIDVKDKTMIGDPNPNYIFGFSFSADYKGFDVSLLANGVAGNQIAKSYRSFADSPLQNYTTDILGRWHGEGTSNKLPRLTSGAHINTQNVSDIFIENGDFLRISNITVGYNFNKLIKKMPFAQTRLYFTVQNLYTFTKYSGMDPEIGYGPSDSGKAFSSGIDLGYYPSPRTVMVGASIKF